MTDRSQMKIDPLEDVIVGTTPLELHLAGVHPRLYATQADFDRLRGLMHTEPYASMSANLRRTADEYAAQRCPGPEESEGQDLRGRIGEPMPRLALMYRLIGEKEYLDAAIHYMQMAVEYQDWTTSLVFGHWGHGFAVAYDWLYNDLDPTVRESLSAVLRQRVQVMFDAWSSYRLATGIYYTFNHMAVPFAGLTAGAAALYGEEPDVGPVLRMVLDKARLMTTALGGDGMCQEGLNYGGYFLNYLMKSLVLVDELLGVDMISDCEFLRNVPMAYQYASLPRCRWSEHQMLFHFGDANLWDWAPAPDRIFAQRFRDGHSRWLTDQTVLQAGASKSENYLNLLWHDPGIEAVPPASLPTLRHFDDQDIVFMRSDWSGDENVFAFKCGPHSGHRALRHYNHEIGGGHMHPDAGTFLLFACGDWLIGDDGYCAKWTRQQNTLLIDGIGQSGEGGDWFEGVYLRPERRWASILHVESNPHYDYAVGDAAPAYPISAGLRTFLRHVIFIKPDCWVVVDQLESERPATFELFFHAYHPFVAAGENEFTVSAPNGSLRVTPLLPEFVNTNAFRQPIAMGSIPSHAEQHLEALVLSNPQPATQATFVTALYAFPTSGSPRVTASIEQQDGRHELVLTNCEGVAIERLALDLTGSQTSIIRS